MAEKFEKPKGFKKKAENFWYHYKWHVIIISFFVFAIAVCTVQCATKEKPDVTVIYFTEQPTPDMALSIMEDEIEKYMTDTNGNGEVLCQIVNLSQTSTNGAANQSVSNTQRLLAEVASGENFFFIIDQYGYDYFAKQGLDFYDKKGFLPDLDGYGWNWNGSTIRDALADFQMPKDLYFCVRQLHETNDTKANAKTKANVEAILQNIVNGAIATPTDKQ